MVAACPEPRAQSHRLQSRRLTRHLAQLTLPSSKVLGAGIAKAGMLGADETMMAARVLVIAWSSRNSRMGTACHCLLEHCHADRHAPMPRSSTLIYTRDGA